MTSWSVSAFCCWTNVWRAVKKLATVDPGEHERRRVAFAARRAADRVREHDRDGGARRTPANGSTSCPASACGQVGDRERRAEPGAGRDAEQVRVGERVVEDALVRRPGDGEHPADERREQDARDTDIPQDRLLRRVERRGDAGIPSFAPSERSTSPTPMSTGPATTPTANATARNDTAATAHPGVTPRSRERARRCGGCLHSTPYWRPRRSSAVPIARTRLTSRGPQRDAIESSSRTTEPDAHRGDPRPPGTAATVPRALRAAHRVGEDDQVGVRRDDVLGRELRIVGARPVASSAMLRRPNIA